MTMNKLPLTKTNPYLKDKATRKHLIQRSVVSSCRVEGINYDTNKAKIKIPSRGIKNIYKSK